MALKVKSLALALTVESLLTSLTVYIRDMHEMFLAEKGGGARLNGEKIQVSSIQELDRAMLATGFAYNIRETSNNNLNHFEKFLMRTQAIRRDGVAAVDLCYVAAGRYDGFWELNLFPWDVAAGVLMIKEAGGKLSDFKGEDFDVYKKEIVASNGFLLSQMVKVLKEN